MITLMLAVILVLSTSVVVQAQSDTTTTTSSEACSVCRNGYPVSLPDKSIELPGIGVTTCAIAQGVSASLLKQGSNECNGIQSISSICGCLVESVLANPCRMCAGGGEMTLPAGAVHGLKLQELLGDAAMALPDSDDPVPCEVLDAALLGGGFSPESDVCTTVQSAGEEVCGCQEVVNEQTSTTGDNNNNEQQQADTTTTTETETETAPENSGENEVENTSPNTDSDNAESNEKGVTSNTATPSRCNVCAAGGAMSRPDRALPQQAAADLGLAVVVSDCASLDVVSGLLVDDSVECTALQGLGPYCGCQVSQTACTFCQTNDNNNYTPNKSLQSWLESNAEFLGLDWQAAWSPVASHLNCELAASFVGTLEPDQHINEWDNDALCLAAQLRSSACGCEPSWQAVVLLWAYRTSGILSWLGSAWMIWDALSTRVKRASTYHQLVVGLSSFILISSTAYILVGILFPEETGAYMARGNDTTCSIQGFLIQLGLTSVLFNALLAAYHVLVVQFDWDEAQFERYRLYGYVAAVGVGVSLAGAAWPFYGQQLAVCYIPPPLTEDASRGPISVFFTTPVVSTLIVMLSSVVAVGVVAYQERKWPRVEDDGDESLHPPTKVLRQGFGYMVSFAVTVPLVILSYYVEYKTSTHFWLLAVVSGATPAQGFLNAIVYFFLDYHRTKTNSVSRHDKKKQQENSSAGGTRSLLAGTALRSDDISPRPPESTEGDGQARNPILSCGKSREDQQQQDRDDNSAVSGTESSREEDGYNNFLEVTVSSDGGDGSDVDSDGDERMTEFWLRFM